MSKTTYPASAPRMLLVATIDRALRLWFPHMDECRAAGWKIDVACRVTDFDDEIREHADRLFDIPFVRFPVHPLNLVTLAKLTSIIKRGRYDIVHGHTPAGGFIGRLAATFARTPIRIYTAHGFHFHPEGRPLSNFIFKQIEKIAGRHLSDLVEVVNNEDYQNALSMNVIPKEKLVKIDGTGIVTSRFDPGKFTDVDRLSVRRELGLDPHSPVLGIIAELIPRKRVHDCFEVIALLKEEFPSIALIVLGDGPLKLRLSALAKERGIAENVNFLGFRRDIPRYSSIMDVFVFSTQQEGMPLALMEAMCMGIPAVATNIRGNRDIIFDQENGFLVPLGNPSAMAEVCRKLLRDNSFARSIGARGRKSIIEKFDIKHTVSQQMVQYYRAIEGSILAGRLRKDVGSGKEIN